MLSKKHLAGTGAPATNPRGTWIAIYLLPYGAWFVGVIRLVPWLQGQADDLYYDECLIFEYAYVTRGLSLVSYIGCPATASIVSVTYAVVLDITLFYWLQYVIARNHRLLFGTRLYEGSDDLTARLLRRMIPGERRLARLCYMLTVLSVFMTFVLLVRTP